ncbi:hypothetical protein B0T21DRAFT_447960 [Apiosordaria backusii]|uniref:Ankyrin repeat protein n=1 Tax=Apiosordaria backusii TaxID=314023 RepID=A0AA40EST3_9PEZI|nr:hypothetical protein B0T21DRAFT_447960 [Apiosordaria backusii]
MATWGDFETVLYEAVRFEGRVVIRKILERPDAETLNAKLSGNKETAFQNAVFFGYLDGMREFLDTEFIRRGNQLLGKLLIQAVSSDQCKPPRNLDVARLLLIHGAEVNRQNTKGFGTPLYTWHVCKRIIFPDEFEQAGLGYHILDIYESWIAKQEDVEISLFRDFCTLIDKQDNDQKDHTPDQASLKIGEEVGIIYELKDVLEELFILKQLFTTQGEVAERYHSTCLSDKKKHTISSADFIQQSRIQALIDRADRLEENAKRVLDNVDYLVQVKQAQSSLVEAKLATGEANKSRKLNNYVLLLTSVTSTPLAFMVGLFALSIDNFPRDEKGELFFTSSWITGRFVSGELVSLFVTAVGFLIIQYLNKAESRHTHPARPAKKTFMTPVKRAQNQLAKIRRRQPGEQDVELQLLRGEA